MAGITVFGYASAMVYLREAMPRKKTKKKLPEKNWFLAVIIGFIVLLGVGVGTCLWLKFGTNTVNAPGKTETDAVRFARDYPQVGEDNVFVYRNASQIVDILKGGTGVVFLGFPECPWCQAYAPMLNDVAKDVGIEKIFYCDIREDRTNDTAEYRAIVELLRGHLDLDNEGRPRVFVPDVTVVDRGVIIGHDNETSLISGGVTPGEYWTHERVLVLNDRLRVMMGEIADGGCVEVCQE
jgi:thiol-disulfide isomerase/thioredoxin